MNARLKLSSRRFDVADILERYGLVVALVVFIAVFGALRPTTFLTWTNFSIILNTKAALALLVLAILPSLAAGLYDMSIAGAMGVAYVLLGHLNVTLGWSLWPSIVVTLMVGVVVGIVNTILIVHVGINSLIVTLGMGTFLNGIAQGINGNTVTGLDPRLTGFFRFQIFHVQVCFIFVLAVAFGFWYFFNHTPAGRYMFVVGAGPEVARLAGLNVKRLQTAALLTASIGSTLTAVVLAGIQGSVNPTAAPQLLLPAFAAAFLGSTAIVSGRFNAWGAFLAVYFLATGITGLQFLGMSGWIENVFYGGSLVLAVLLSYLARRRKSAV